MDANTIHDFVTTRQLALREELAAIAKEEDDLKVQLEIRLAQLNKRREEIYAENYILENFDDSQVFEITTTTTTTIKGRMANGTRMHIQDSIRKIFEDNGCGMGPNELISKLNRNYGYKFSYRSGYNFLRKQPYIEQVDRGFYQYRK